MKMSTVNGTLYGKMKKVNNVSGIWACNYSNYKPFLPQKQNKKPKEPKETKFQSLLDKEIELLKEEQK